MSNNKADVNNLGRNIVLYNLDENNINDFYQQNSWIDRKSFTRICHLYEFPEKTITVVIQNYYIDAAYRDVYYHYWAKFHFNWPRHCKRLAIFQNSHSSDEFWDNKKESERELQKDFLGTVVIRPSYTHNETGHTYGRTLLNPYKMVTKEPNTNEKIHPFRYMITAQYRMHLLGKTFTTHAFVFCSQDGVAMKCAETAIYCLGDFESASSPLYARVLPSDIQEKLSHRISERILPSHGLYCNDISYILKEFGYSPMIYAGAEDYQRTLEDSFESSIDAEKNEVISHWDNIHETNFKNWFHYYVESAIPILAVTAVRPDAKKHATLVIGHGLKQKKITECKQFKLGDYPCIDTSQLYNTYIINDDNQIPYVEEAMDHFTIDKNYKLEAYIVPLEKHVFLEAAAAVTICDTFIENQKDRLKKAIEVFKNLCYSKLSEVSDKEKMEDLKYLIESISVSSENPLTVRYYLANSAEYKQFRIKNGIDIDEQIFYADVLMPKSVWVAEISTFRCYQEGYVIGEVVLDATASSRSKVDSVILLRISGNGVYKLPQETYTDLEKKLAEKEENIMLPSMFIMYSNFQYCKEKE